MALTNVAEDEMNGIFGSLPVCYQYEIVHSFA